MKLDPVRTWHPDPAYHDASPLVCRVSGTISTVEWTTYADRPRNASRFVTHPHHLSTEDFLQRRAWSAVRREQTPARTSNSSTGS